MNKELFISIGKKIDKFNIVLTIIAYIFLIPSTWKMMQISPEEKSELWIFPAIVVGFSLVLWFFAKFWMPLVVSQFFSKDTEVVEACINKLVIPPLVTLFHMMIVVFMINVIMQ